MTPQPAALYRILLRTYGARNWWPVVRGQKCLYLPEFLKRKRTSPEILEIMIGAILTQNTAWNNVVRALIGLKSRKLMVLKALETIQVSELAKVIRPSGYYNQKAKKIKALVLFIRHALCGAVDALGKLGPVEARRKLLEVWGIGPETADSILLYGFGYPVFVVDAYTRRMFTRIGLLSGNPPYENIQLFFHNHLSRDRKLFREYHALIVEHGKSVCTRVPRCGCCPVRKTCRYFKRHGSYAPERTLLRTRSGRVLHKKRTGTRG